MREGVTPVLQVERLTRRLGAQKALDDVSLEVRAGEIVGICGERGAGKRKLLDVIVGNERADSGRIVFDGNEVSHLSAAERRRLKMTSSLHQAPVWERLREALHPRTVAGRLDHAAAIAGRYRGERARRAELVEHTLATVGLAHAMGSRHLHEFSAGQRQRALLAELLIGEPKLVVLDEPFKDFDAATLSQFQTLLGDICKTFGTTILLSDRSGHSSSVCNRLYYLAEGKLGARDNAIKIFISYRREDEAGFARALFQELNDTFHRRQLFLDVEGYIAPGDDYARLLTEQVQECDAVLVMIGPRWLAAADDRGARRLDNAADWVRIEIVSALEKAKHVIPVLVGGAEMPGEEALAEPLRPLCRRQAVRIGAEAFASDVQRLVRHLQSIRLSAAHQSAD